MGLITNGDVMVIEDETDYLVRWGDACDAAFRVVEEKLFDRVWDDEFQHTSSTARAIVDAVFEALGVVALVDLEDEFEEPIEHDHSG